MTYALIPEAGGDAWEWHRLVLELEARGHEALAIRLPSEDDTAGWAEYADAIADALGDRRGINRCRRVDGWLPRPDRLYTAACRLARPPERDESHPRSGVPVARPRVVSLAAAASVRRGRVLSPRVTVPFGSGLFATDTFMLLASHR